MQRQDRNPVARDQMQATGQTTGAPGPIPYVVAVTGHRDLLDDDAPGAEYAVRALLRRVLKASAPRTLYCISALADGADQLFARQVIALRRQLRRAWPEQPARIRLHVALPMPTTNYISSQRDAAACPNARHAIHRRSPWAFAHRFHALASEADAVCEVPRPPFAGQVQAPPPGQCQGQNACAFSNLASYLSSHADLLVALWHGLKAGSANGDPHPSGTWDTVSRRMNSYSAKSRAHRLALPEAGSDGLVRIPVRSAAARRLPADLETVAT